MNGAVEYAIQYDQEWKIFADWLGVRRQRTVRTPKDKTSGCITYGVVSDLHVPWHDLDSVYEASEWLQSQKATRLIVGGDYLDLFALSRFLQFQSRPILEEFIEGRKILDYWARMFASIWICEGNHESREKKYLAARLPPDLLEWFYHGGVLERLCGDMPNVHLVKRTIAGSTLHWIAQIGKDAIIGHPEKFSTIPMRPSDNFRLWLQNWHDVIRICRPRLVMSGHTHQAGIVAGHEVVVETGCLCLTQGYSLEPRIYSKPQRHAATIFTQIDGVTDLNSLKQFYPRIDERPKPLPPDVQ